MLAQASGQRRVELDRDDLLGAGGQGQGERTRPRSDLEEHVVRLRSDHAQESLDGCGPEEVLSEAAGHGARRLWGGPTGIRRPPAAGPWPVGYGIGRRPEMLTA
jgi:hypothetical protein